MSYSVIDVDLLSKMFLAGAQNLENKKEWINELNVFPVPDGDTGTNMTMTIMAAAKVVSSLEAPTMEELCKAISSETMRGARGNSGVILSQLLRGFTKVVKKVETVDINTLCEALTKATETAYRAVMSPKEGTILTVARGISEKAEQLKNTVTDLDEFIRLLIEEGDAVLAKTPEMLPVLKQAGVVDSGGQGLMQIVKGTYDAFCGKEIEINIEAASSSSVKMNTAEIDTSDIKFGYCTEFIILLDREFTEDDEISFKGYLSSIGDCVVCVSDDEVCKVHVHTNDPGLAIQRALTYGQLNKMKIDNMRIEHQEKVIKDAEKLAKQQEMEATKEKKPFAFVSVSAGDGLSEVFTSLGVDINIEGGQTMNPSTDDFLLAIKKLHAENIYLFPNNGNIILAAQQAQKLTTDCNVFVVPTKNIPQGISAMMNFSEFMSPEENFEAMKEAISNIKTGSVTYAVRNTCIDGVDIKENDIMGLGDHTILAVGSDINDTACQMVEKMATPDSVLISIYYGADITEEHANLLSAKLSESFPGCDVFVQRGGQPIYYYFISVE